MRILFRNFSLNYYQSMFGGVNFSKVSCFQHNLLMRVILWDASYLLDKGRKLNIHKTFKRRPVFREYCTGLEKWRTCVRDILEIKNIVGCRT